MPLYNTKTAAAVLEVTPKWLDNLLSHNSIDDLTTDTQGVARRLSVRSITMLVLAKELIDALVLPAPVALRVASRVLNTPNCELILSPRLRITISEETLKTDVLDRIASAVESAPTPRRGRPSKR